MYKSDLPQTLFPTERSSVTSPAGAPSDGRARVRPPKIARLEDGTAPVSMRKHVRSHLVSANTFEVL